MANTTKLKPRRVNSFNEPSDGKNLWYKNDDQFKWQDWWWWHQSFFKTQAEYDALPSSKESDWNLYIIVDNHGLMEYEELVLLEPSAIVDELNTEPIEYAMKLYNEWHLSFDTEYPCLSDDGETKKRFGNCVIYCDWNPSTTITWKLECTQIVS